MAAWMKRLRVPVCVAIACLLAHAAPPTDDIRVSIPVRSRNSASRPDFRTETDLVLVPVSVTDLRNRIVTGLKRDSFRIFDENSEQEVVQFAHEDAPLSIGIVFDSTGSMTGKLQDSRQAMLQFLRYANPQDEFFLVEFSTKPRLTVPFTANSDAITDRLRLLRPKGKTALLDAVCLAMDTLKRASHPHRALLILSDGGDNNSRYNQLEIRDRIRESDLWIYAMGIFGPHPEALPGSDDNGKKLLTRLAEESGGRHFAVSSAAELPSLAARISLELRNQYVLGFYSNNPSHDAKYRRVHVSVVDSRRLNIAWRPGYYGSGQ